MRLKLLFEVARLVTLTRSLVDQTDVVIHLLYFVIFGEHLEVDDGPEL